MNILISYLFCSKGGVETALFNRLRTVSRTAYAVDLHFFYDYGGMEMFKNWKGRIYIENKEEAIKAIVRRSQYDFIITIDSLGILKIVEQSGYSGKIGLEIHTTYEEGMRYLGSRRMEMVDFIIVPSDYQKRLARQRVRKKKIYVVGNAAGSAVCRRAECRLDVNKRVILWVGRIDEHKNWKLFLRIAAFLHESSDCFLFWIAGGLKSDPRDISKFEKYIYEMDLERHVLWIPQVDYKNMGILYSYAANSGGCYISTSKNESFGMTVIEAMKCRCPVAANAVGAFGEIVGSTRGLCLEDMGKLEHMERIRDYILQEDKSEYLDRAEKYVKEEFSCEAVGKKFCRILDHVREMDQ